MTKSLEIEQAICLLENAGKDGVLNEADYSRIAFLPGLAEHIRSSVEGVLSGVVIPPQENREACPVKKTILLVEDDECLDRSAKRTLESAGHKVIVAADSIKALTLFDQNRDEIDLVVSDIQMRYMTGPELVEMLRLQKKVEALFMFNHPQESSKFEEGLKGAFLRKPFNLFDLSFKIQSLFNKEKR